MLLSSYGVRHSTTVSGEAEIQAEEVRLTGFTLIRGIIASSDVADARQELDRLYEAQVKECGGIDRLRGINDADIVRCPLSGSRIFLDIAVTPRIISALKILLGEYFILQQQNGVINRPADHYQRAWHRDLPYQHFTSSRPLAISVLVFLDEFSVETGGTLVLPASHKAESFPSEDYILAHQTQVAGTPGDAVMFDSMLFHRAGVNQSNNIRRGLNHVYALPFLNQQISLPQALGPGFTEDPSLQRFLGYETAPASSAFEWRKKRLDKLPAQQS
jgi:ectoine hydroxylase-related dioxygenase (phytanoyl-CoA dioxygenase family)